MKTVLLGALILCTFSAKSTNYYFSQSGSDSRTSLAAQNPLTPWKTLTKLNSFFGSLKPGDSVLLKRNETFYGSIKLTKSGTATAPIVIGAYGHGNKPVITSLVTFTDWVSKGNGIWESHNASLGKVLNVVLLNNINQEMGRYPNSDAANKGYLNFESHVSRNSITDNELATSKNWAGAELVIRLRRWVLARVKIKSNTANIIHYTTSSKYDPYDKYGYFIQNNIQTLDKAGEWFYTPSTKKLSVYTGTNKPASSAFQATALSNLVFSINVSYVTIDNINMTGANEDAVYISGGSYITIKNCAINFTGENGVEAYQHNHFVILNNAISNVNNNAIDLGFGVDHALVKNNKIRNTSLIAGLGRTKDGNGNGIYSNGDNTVIEANEIRNTGLNGIAYNGNDVTIKNNLIDSFCLVKDDGSGIYSHGSSSGTAPLYKRRKVTGNIVTNGIGAGPGSNRPSYNCASGIYMDNDASGSEIIDNTFMNCSLYGIFIHNSHHMVIKNNVLYNSSRQISMNQDADNARIRNNIVTNNIFFSKYSTQIASNLISTDDDINLFGKYDSNYYARPLDERMTIYAQYRKNSTIKHSMNLAGWKASFPQDKDSKTTAKQLVPYKINTLKGSNKISSGSLSSESTVSLNVGSLVKGKNYILSYGLKGSTDNDKYLGAYLSNNAEGVQSRKLSTSHTINEMLFTASSTVSSAKIVFVVDVQSKYYLDNITFYEADAKITNPDDSIRCEYNASHVVKSIALNGSYVDVAGKKYLNTVALQPFTSIILIKTEEAIPNVAPVVVITSPSANATFSTSTTIHLNAVATDKDGSIKKVEFYNGSKLLASENISPYSYNWQNVSAGNYIITAKATDDEGLATISSPVYISVYLPNAAPVVNLTSPVENDHFNSHSTITISASATDDDSVRKVEFFNGATLLKTEHIYPYHFSWEGVPDGDYTLTARATDNKGAITISAPVSISVGIKNILPAVQIMSLEENTNFQSSVVDISVNATDADGSITKVEFYNGTRLLWTDYAFPYFCRWSNVAAGNYTITARATDNKGAVTTSAHISINVGTQPASRGVSAEHKALLSINNTHPEEGKILNTADFKLFPNPAVDKVELSFGGLNIYQKAKLVIRNLSGAIVRRSSVTISGKNIQLNVSSLPGGIYTISLSGDKLNITKRLVKIAK